MQIAKSVLLFVVFMCLVPVAYAQEAAPDTSQDDGAFIRRLELSRKIQDLRPAKDQIESAIDRYTARLPQAKREVYKSAIREVFNYKALEKASIDAYAEIYTEGELQAMYNYYKTPEAATASEKSGQYAKIVYPEIIRMLDRAMMRVKTGSASGQ